MNEFQFKVLSIKTAKWSQQDIADKIGVSHVCISEIERGKTIYPRSNVADGIRDLYERLLKAGLIKEVLSKTTGCVS